MAKGKVTIEMEGSSAAIFEFDDLHIDMNQTIHSFYKFGDLVPKEMAPDGELRINIVGVREEGRKKFQTLCGLYDHYERMR
jgi:hypothetical protein